MSLSTTTPFHDDVEVDRKHLILTFGILCIISTVASMLMIAMMIFLKFYRHIRQRFVMNLFISNFFQVFPVLFVLIFLQVDTVLAVFYRDGPLPLFISNFLVLFVLLYYDYFPSRYSIGCILQGWTTTLFISNFFQVFPVTFCLLYYDYPPSRYSIGCILQGWTTTFGTNAASLWSANIALFLALIIIFNANPGKKFELASQLIWLIATILPTLGLMITTPETFIVPIDDNVTCWISSEYPMLRLLFEYALCIVVLLFLLIVYTSMGIHLCRKKNINKSSARIGRLAGFPVVYCFLYLPVSVVRFLSTVGMNPPLIVQNVTMSLIVCDGLVNAILYGYTRNIFFKFYTKVFKNSLEDTSASLLGVTETVQ